MDEQKKFSVISDKKKDINILIINGYLDAHTAPDLEKSIASCINTGGNKILVDFQNLEYISSAGLGVFMAFIEEIRENNGDIKLVNMKEKVYSVFDLLGFPLLFDIENNYEEAIKKFDNNEVKRI